MTPFILQCRKKLPPDGEPSEEHVYDEYRQLRIQKASGAPVISCLPPQAQSSLFGETAITETREGADQSEVAAFHASQFGETAVTKTIEGTDQSEVTTLLSSKFGETTYSRTAEGVDQSEVTGLQMPQVAETSNMANPDGMSSADSVSVSSDAPYYHF